MKLLDSQLRWAVDPGDAFLLEGTKILPDDCVRKPALLRGKLPRIDPLCIMTVYNYADLITRNPAAIGPDLHQVAFGGLISQEVRRSYLGRNGRGSISANLYAGCNPNALTSAPAIVHGLTGGHITVHFSGVLGPAHLSVAACYAARNPTGILMCSVATYLVGTSECISLSMLLRMENAANAFPAGLPREALASLAQACGAQAPSLGARLSEILEVRC